VLTRRHRHSRFALSLKLSSAPRAAEVTLSRYAAAFELQFKLAERSRRASISV